MEIRRKVHSFGVGLLALGATTIGVAGVLSGLDSASTSPSGTDNGGGSVELWHDLMHDPALITAESFVVGGVVVVAASSANRGRQNS